MQDAFWYITEQTAICDFNFLVPHIAVHIAVHIAAQIAVHIAAQIAAQIAAKTGLEGHVALLLFCCVSLRLLC